MDGADIGVGWIDNDGLVHFQVSNRFYLFFDFMILNIGSICPWLFSTIN